MVFPARTAFLVLITSVSGFCQLPSVRCDSIQSPLHDCPFLTVSPSNDKPVGVSIASLKRDSETPADGSSGNSGKAFVATPVPLKPEGFHWGRALLESFTFLSIEQAYVVHDDYRWVTVENGVPFNHYWRDYKD